MYTKDLQERLVRISEVKNDLVREVTFLEARGVDRDDLRAKLAHANDLIHERNEIVQQLFGLGVVSELREIS